MTRGYDQRDIPLSELKLIDIDRAAVERDEARALQLGGEYLVAFKAWKLSTWYAERTRARRGG